MMCEHKVRKVKDLFKSFHGQLEPTLIERAISALNPQMLIKDHFMDCIGKGDHKPGGDHRHDHITTEEKMVIREEIKKVKMFSSDFDRPQVKFNVRVRRIWENLTDEKVDNFLNRNCDHYKRKKTYRFE